MHFTRRLCGAAKSAVTSKQTMLLPPETLGESIWEPLLGAYSSLFDDKSQTQFKQYLQDNVIRDDILQTAQNCTVLTLRLFHNLQNPLFEEFKFNPKEFMSTVGPALENLHDIIGNLSNEMNQVNTLADVTLDDVEVKLERMRDEQQPMDPVEIFGENAWEEAAKNDSDSLAASLKRMTSEAAFQDYYYSTLMAHKVRAKFRSQAKAVLHDPVYIGNEVKEVALIRARVKMLSHEGEAVFDEDTGLDKEPPSKDKNVASQLHVLYEISRRFKILDASSVTDDSEQSVNNDDKQGVYTDDDKDETIQYTGDVGVAVFEGWLNGGPDKKLRWKLATIRPPFEFPFTTQ
jgi:hypothetical protein